MSKSVNGFVFCSCSMFMFASAICPASAMQSLFIPLSNVNMYNKMFKEPALNKIRPFPHRHSSFPTLSGDLPLEF